MLNQTSWWKYLVVVVFTAIGIYFALPNLFGSDDKFDHGAVVIAVQAVPVCAAIARFNKSMLFIVAKRIGRDAGSLRQLTNFQCSLHCSDETRVSVELLISIL